MRDLSSPAWTPDDLIRAYRWNQIIPQLKAFIEPMVGKACNGAGLDELVGLNTVGGIDQSKSIWANHTMGYDFQENVWP